MTKTAEILILMGGGVTALGAILYGARRLYLWGSALSVRAHALAHLITRELSYNHGSSMKDDLALIRAALEESAIDRGDLHRRVNAVVRRARRLHPELDWRAADRAGPEYPHDMSEEE